jgi:hypothetical protein
MNGIFSMDLKIAHNDAAHLRARCQITTLRPAGSDEPYESGAAVPDGHWEPLPANLPAALQPSHSTDHRTVVELVALPPGPPPASFSELADTLQDPLATYLGHYTSQPRLRTTTPNPEKNLYVGIHVDNHDRLPFPARHLGRRSLCINLGPAPRYLLLGDRDIRTVTRAVHSSYQHSHPHTDDLRAYVAQGRPINVLRIRLAPGEGYIAPTELFPHDGSTQDSVQASTAAFWLGRWAARSLPWLA